MSHVVYASIPHVPCRVCINSPCPMSCIHQFPMSHVVYASIPHVLCRVCINSPCPMSCIHQFPMSYSMSCMHEFPMSYSMLCMQHAICNYIKLQDISIHVMCYMTFCANFFCCFFFVLLFNNLLAPEAPGAYSAPPYLLAGLDLPHPPSPMDFSTLLFIFWPDFPPPPPPFSHLSLHNCYTLFPSGPMQVSLSDGRSVLTFGASCCRASPCLGGCGLLPGPSP